MSNVIHISTTHVKGTINSMGGEYVKGTLVNADGSFESAVIRFPSFEVVIVPTTKSFEELYAEYKEKTEVFGDFFVIEMGKNHVFYKEQRGFSGRKIETYMVILLKEGKHKSYLLEGKGLMLNPILQEEDAKKALAIARTFEPAD